jgi:threonine dehydrogenase-like Zn-dependent dehydrogenase
VHPIGALPFHVAALAEPFACVLHGVDRAGRIEGQEALVLGAGPIGLMMMMALGARGAASVTMTDVEESRLEQAKSLGADEAVHADALDPAHRFGLVVDCTGVPSVCERMPSRTKDGGAILFFGVCPPAARITLSPYEMFRRELTLIGSHSLSNNIPDALRVLSRLGPRAEALVSHRLSLEEIAERLRAPVKKGSMKIQFAAA